MCVNQRVNLIFFILLQACVYVSATYMHIGTCKPLIMTTRRFWLGDAMLIAECYLLEIKKMITKPHSLRSVIQDNTVACSNCNKMFFFFPGAVISSTPEAHIVCFSDQDPKADETPSSLQSTGIEKG